jgi:hypothetical protein|tara:strand:+ start:54 stop:215 length:162 start_codon:yes stop_codon:yes gene_type:complete
MAKPKVTRKKIGDKFFNVVAGVPIGMLTKAVNDIQITRKVLKKKNPNPRRRKR